MSSVLKDKDAGLQSPENSDHGSIANRGLNGYSISNGQNGHRNGHSTNGCNGNRASKNDAIEDPVAICGMACRLPGGISTPEQLWKFLINKQDGRTRVPESRYNTDGFSSTRGKPGATRTDYGYFLSDDLRSFDGSRFHMPVKELERCDPQQRLFLYVSQECVDDAGETNTSGRRIGVYVGDMQRGWSDTFEKESQNYGTYHLLGLDDFALANRVSYEMNLKGPSVTLRTACASSLSALSDACKAISAGECDGAIVGGASIILGPDTSIQVGEQGVLSPDGSCKAFSANANGYARAEGVSAIYIKPLSRALQDGNPVRAVIRAATTNHNGRSSGITAPNAAAQQDVIRQAYHMAGISDFTETTFVECHGTGTPTGDPIEAEAVGSIFGGEKGIYIGSVKPNLGHSEGASGMTSVLKAILALENKTIPPNTKFDIPNPEIPFARYNIKVPVDPVPWPEGRKQRVSVNNFGIGGVNSHIILDSAELFGAGQNLEEASDHLQLLVYSAATSESLSSMGESYAAYLAKNPERIEDLAYTLANKREHMKHRAFLVASRDTPGAPSPAVKSPDGRALDVIMVFTGQGAQWPQMGRDLIKSNKDFKASIQAMDALLKNTGSADLRWTIEGELEKPASSSRVDLAEFSQPLCTAVQVALVDSFKAVGIIPSAVVGHSSGEIAGAYAAGALSLQEAIVAAYHRGAAAGWQNRSGAMAAIGLSWKEVEQFLVPNVGVACENSPKSVTLSGDADKVAEVVQTISAARPDVLARLLKVNKAYHSYHMAEVSSIYFDLVGLEVEGRAPRVPFFSSVEGRLLNETDQLGAKYWQKNLESTVLFKDAVSGIAKHPLGQNAVFLEIGPHSALSGPVRQILAEHGSVSQSPYVAAMLRGQSSAQSLLSALGKLYTLGATIDFKHLYPAGVTLRDLPPYPWDNSGVYWHETRVMREWRERSFKHHDLLGLRTLESTHLDPIWRNLFHLDNAPWVRDHVINGNIVFPFAAYVAMAGEAIRQIGGTPDGFQLRNVTATTALVVPEDKPVELVTSFHRVDSGSRWWNFSIASHNGHTWIQHFHGKAAALERPLEPATPITELPRVVDTSEWYENVSRTGFNFGPAFRCIVDLKSSTIIPSRARATIKNSTNGEESYYYIHPTAMDNVFQLVPVASLHGLSWKLELNITTAIADISIAPCSTDFIAIVTGRTPGNGTIMGDCEGILGDKTVIRVSGVTINVLDHRNGVDTHAAARPVWGPHFDFQRLTELLGPVTTNQALGTAITELTDLALLYVNRIISKSSQNPPHLSTYRAWVQLQLGTSSENKLSDDELLNEVQAKARDLSGSPIEAVAQAIETTTATIRDVTSEKNDATVILENAGLFSRISDLINQFDLSTIIGTLAHTKPNLRVLELSAGSGSWTSKCLQGLQGRYSTYTFTDASGNLVTEGKERFKNNASMEFETLDIGGDLKASGFADADDRQYDLIIAINAVHRTNNLSRALGNIHTLLRPNGRLILQEVAGTPDARWVDLVMGAVPSWWGAIKETSTQLQRLDAHAWKKSLRTAGLEIVEAVTAVPGDPLHLNNLFVCKPTPPASYAIHKKVSILTVNSNANITDITVQLKGRGYDVSHITLCDEPPVDTDIIALLDGKTSFFSDMSAEVYQQFNRFICGLRQSGIFWISQLSVHKVEDPNHAQVVGFGRAIRAELDIDFALCQTETDFADSMVLDVFEYFEARYAAGRDQTYTDAAPEMEFAVYDGSVHVGRYYPFSLPDEHLTIENGDTAVLKIPRVGHLNELHWQSHPATAPLADQVEIAVFASGLNHKDLSIASGTTERQEEPHFGFEGAGIVRRVGQSVTSLCVGDRVAFLSRKSMSTTVVLSENFAAKIPQNASFSEAAAIPFAYTSAVYSLLDLGRLDKGQSVLIHGFQSHLGLAALRIAQLVGANIYVTSDVDTIEEHGLAKNRIFDTRDSSFANALLRETQGEGVSLLLSVASLAGDAGREVYRCVADCGRVVNIAQDATTLHGDILDGKSVSYMVADLDRLLSVRPEAAARHLHLAMRIYLDGAVTPTKHVKVFAARDAAQAFSHMGEYPSGDKAVVEIRTEAADSNSPATIVKPEISVVQRERHLTFDNKASYILVGGFGGIGRLVAIWLAENGAGNIIFLSRSAGTEASHQQVISELKSMGAGVQAIKGSVSSLADVSRAINGATYPVRGIIQMSTVLRDTAWGAMTYEDWTAAVEPKVLGTWNLHHAASEAGASLDFFVMFSSIAAVVGTPGQTNYAAGNTFLDAFAQYRNALGLPASTISVGDVGVVARDASLLQGLKSMGFVTVRGSDVVNSLSLAVKKPSPKASYTYDGSRAFVDPSSFAIGLGSTIPLSSPDNRTLWARDVRLAMYRNSSVTADGTVGLRNDGLKAFLSSARADKAVLLSPEAATFLAVEIGTKVHTVLGKPIESLRIDLSLPDIGMDSLVGIEMRKWWRTTFGFEISLLEMLGMGTLALLGKHAADGLAKLFHDD